MVDKKDILKRLNQCWEELSKARDLINKAWLEDRYLENSLDIIKESSMEIESELDNLIEVCQDLILRISVCK